MSQANAAAIRRRTNNVQPSPAPTTQIQQQPTTDNRQQPQGYTIQQVITTFDKRIKQLEEFTQNNINTSTNNGTTTEQFNEMINEFNNRFELMVIEINDLKDIIIKLQSYTMEVNKTLMNERIHILSEFDNNTVNTDNTTVLTNDLPKTTESEQIILLNPNENTNLVIENVVEK
jgi:archaellum component FlaF (FlaF/FlaG flagellin family)